MDRALRFATPVLLVLIGILLGVVLLQLHNLEERFVVQTRQLRALGEATEKLAAGGVQVGPAKTEEIPPGVKLLHPEVENFLKEGSAPAPPPDAPTDGLLGRPWVGGDPKGFVTILENDANIPNRLEPYTGSTIARRDIFGNPDDWVGDLAWRVEVTDDYKEFTVYLRQGIRWHPVTGVDTSQPRYAWLRGEHPFTAHDLEFTFDMIMNPQVENGFLKNYFSELESWKALDDHTFVVRWKKKQFINVEQILEQYPIPKFLFSRAEDGTEIPKETLGLRLNSHWYRNKGYIGTGPYYLESYQPGTSMRLVRMPSHLGVKPPIATVTYAIYTDRNQTVLKLKSGELDYATLSPGQYRDESRGTSANSPFLNGSIECKQVLRPGYFYIGWNMAKPLFADRRVRLAMTLALNRRKIIDNILSGLGVLATGPFTPGTPGSDPNVSPWPFDLAEARKQLADAGWTDSDGDGIVDKQLRPSDAARTPFEFTLLIYGSSPEYTAFANVYRDDLLKIGVKMRIEAVEWSLMQKRMEEKKFDAFTGAWSLTWTPDLFQVWHSSQADVPKGSNRVAFRNERADAIVEQLRTEFDPDVRQRLSHEFHRLLHDQQPYTFLWSIKDPHCWWKHVRGVVFGKARPIVDTTPWWTTDH